MLRKYQLENIFQVRRQYQEVFQGYPRLYQILQKSLHFNENCYGYRSTALTSQVIKSLKCIVLCHLSLHCRDNLTFYNLHDMPTGLPMMQYYTYHTMLSNT